MNLPDDSLAAIDSRARANCYESARIAVGLFPELGESESIADMLHQAAISHGLRLSEIERGFINLRVFALANAPVAGVA